MPKLTNQERAKLIIRPNKGDKFVTTRSVKLVRELPGGPGWSQSGGIEIPKGTPITYTGDYMWGSDPGPGFPEFKAHLPTGDVVCHAVGEDLEYVSWPLNTWLKSV